MYFKNFIIFLGAVFIMQLNIIINQYHRNI